MRRSNQFQQIAQADLARLDRLAALISPDQEALRDWCETYFKQHRRRFATDLQIVQAEVPVGARFLEYGAVPLLVTAALQDAGYQVSALDLAPERFSRSIAALGLDVRRCNVETEAVPFAEESFDAVLFNELFEHLRINPIMTLREVHRVLKPGGKLLLSTPNLRSARGIRNLLLRNQGHAVSAGVFAQYEKLETLGHMGHVREYTTRELVEFVQRIGFRVDQVIFRGASGGGLIGLAERWVPSLRPFFSLVAIKEGKAP